MLYCLPLAKRCMNLFVHIMLQGHSVDTPVHHPISKKNANDLILDPN